jgi:citrate lyase subunit beta/citryl-CoA lyase
MTARSWLFVPGDRPDRFGKAAACGAHVVVHDLEDAVGAAGKDDARAAVGRWLSGPARGFVRINASGTAWHPDDLAAAGSWPGLAGVMVPKAEDPGVLAALVRRLTVPVVALVETARGVSALAELCRVPGVERIAFGSLDYALDVGCAHEPEALLTARSLIVLESRAAGLATPVDGVTTALDGGDDLERDVGRARRLGFGGKLCVHPSQVAAVNAGFAPTGDQIRWARAIVAAAGEGATRGADGHLIDRPVLARAEALLAEMDG